MAQLPSWPPQNPYSEAQLDHIVPRPPGHRSQVFVDGVQVDAGLDSLEAALRSGFEQFNKVREDPNLDNLRKNERFDKIINQYDEKVIDFT